MKSLLLATIVAVSALGASAASSQPKFVDSQKTGHGMTFFHPHDSRAAVILKDGGNDLSGPGVIVHLCFNFDPEKFAVTTGGYIDNNLNDSRCYTYLYPNWMGWPDTDVKIPEGTYDFLWEFFELKGSELGDSYVVVKENVTVEEGMTLTFSPDDATECFEFIPLLPNGDRVKLQLLNKDEELDEVEVVEPGNVNAIYTYTRLNFGTPRAECGFAYFADNRNANDPELYSSKFYVSPTESGRYKPSCYAVIFNMEGSEAYIQASSIIPEQPIGGEYSTIVENYTKLPPFDYVQSPYMRENSVGDIPLGQYDYYSFNRGELTLGFGAGWYSTCDVEFAWSPNAAADGICDGIFRKIVDGNILYEDEWESYLERVEITPQTVIPIDGEYISRCVNYLYGRTPEKIGGDMSVGYGPFNYSVFDCEMLIGNSVPVLLTNPGLMVDPGKFNFFPTAYGRLGEQRDNDNSLISYNVKNNGEPLLEGVGDFQGAFISWQFSGGEAGKMEVELVDENIEVDGIPGYNRTLITADYTNPEAPWSSPVLMRLMTRNYDGKIIDRFATPEDGYFNFSCGDFTFVGIPVTEWETIPSYDVTECDVKVEYAPNGTDNWQPMTAEKLSTEPDISFGYLYRCDLSEVELQSSNFWYDVRISLTNEAGNTQQQTLSPVFRIDTVNSLPVTSVNAASTAKPVYYNLQGIRVENPSPGNLYIESTPTGSRKVRL